MYNFSASEVTTLWRYTNLFIYLFIILARDVGQTDTQTDVRFDTRCYFNVRSVADVSQLNLPHGTTSEKWKNRKKTKK